jgi:hypothetical protein
MAALQLEMDCSALRIKHREQQQIVLPASSAVEHSPAQKYLFRTPGRGKIPGLDRWSRSCRSGYLSPQGDIAYQTIVPLGVTNEFEGECGHSTFLAGQC